MTAGLNGSGRRDHVVARLLWAPRAVLAVLVNETAVDARRRLTIAGRSWPVSAGRSWLMLFERATGDLLVTNSGEPLEHGEGEY